MSDLVPDVPDAEARELSEARPPVSVLVDCMKMGSVVCDLERSNAAERLKNEQLLGIISDLIENVELLCFDLGMCDYIFDPKDGSALRELFERCFQLKEKQAVVSYVDVDSIRAHMSYLFERIEYFQSNTQLNQSNCPSFDSIEKGLVVELQQHLKQVKGLVKKRSGGESEKFSGIDVNEYFGFDPKPGACEFAKFMRKEVLKEDALSPDLKELINRVAYRMTVLNQLQEQISVMRSIADSEFGMEKEDVLRSPYMQLLLDSCCFLKRILKVSDKARLGLKMRNVTAMLQDEREVFREFVTALFEKESGELRELEAALEKDEQANQEMSGSVKPILSHLSDLLDEDRLRDMGGDVRSIFQKIDMAKRSDIQQIDTLRRIEGLLSQGMDGYREVKRALFQDRNLLSSLVDRYRAEDSPRRLETENALLDGYQTTLRDWIRSKKGRKPGNVVNELKSLLATLSSQMAQTQVIERKFDEMLAMNSDHVAIAIDQKTAEIDAAKETLKALDQQLGELEIELHDLRERRAAKFSLGEETQDGSDEYINSVFESNLKSLMEKITCPVCKSRQRDTIILTCGHALCRECIENCDIRKACPVCLKAYSTSSLRPFLQ